MRDLFVVKGLNVFKNLFKFDVVQKNVNSLFDTFRVKYNLKIFGLDFVQFNAFDFERVLDHFVKYSMFALIEHFKFMGFHLLELINEFNFALERVLVGIVELLKLVRVIKFYFLDINLLQNNVIDDELNCYVIFLWFVSHLIRITNAFFFTLKESTVSVEYRSYVNKVLKFKHVFFALLISKVMMNQFNLVLNFNALLNINFYCRV